MTLPGPSSPRRERRTAANLIVFVIGLLLTIGFYAAIRTWAPPDSLVIRYTCAHPVEYTETWLFFWAMAALGAKAWNLRRQRSALAASVLPAWSGQPMPVSEAQGLLSRVAQLPRRLQGTLLVGRIRGALDFVCSRGSTEGLDDHLRNQADADADAVDGSYSLVRFITWAIPILGFLGTVLGITNAIANVTPEQLAKSITGVTDGLALAFDTTAIALAFSMCVMFFSFVMDRAEQSVLQAVDATVEAQLAHRFERLGHDGNDYFEVLRQNTRVLLQATEQLVERQADLWSRSMEQMRTRIERTEKEQHEQLTMGLRRLLEQTVESHQQRLATVEKQTLGELLKQFGRVSQELRDTTGALDKQGARAAEQAAVLGQLLESEKQLLRLQETLNQNLQVVAQAGTFQQAIHSLTAAIHLLTSRVHEPAPALNLRASSAKGTAA